MVSIKNPRRASLGGEMCRDYLPDFQSCEDPRDKLERLFLEGKKMLDKVENKNECQVKFDELQERVEGLERLLERELRTPIRVCTTCNGDGIIADDGKL